jgi:hypothetical protein
LLPLKKPGGREGDGVDLQAVERSKLHVGHGGSRLWFALNQTVERLGTAVSAVDLERVSHHLGTDSTPSELTILFSFVYGTILAPDGSYGGEKWETIVLLDGILQREAEQFKLDAPRRAAKDL